ncbi:KinB-signaling pathway activation protein [Rossellomorea aquimaris]|uniref:KinB-signaling pathway activation protein n=1 Tax=Rossellomorea aquimaris TaxID=189382 RepID=UPI001CD5CE9C|nr:KinB-signaling pathway activation protein [Rossellomorea aquimaris]MCA1057101.1 KinB-signaling pathway activation protein [Rossellomorea aquimaris]
MTIRNWIRFFVHTLTIGGVITAIASLFIRWDQYSPYIQDGNVIGILSSLLWFLFVGFTFSVISQMGYFAYLTIHQFGLGMFKTFWNSVQIVLIGFVLFDLIYFRFRAFAEEDASYTPYILLGIGILLVGMLVAYVKNKQSDSRVNTFISALFFMVVVTTLEWLPVLLVNSIKWLYLMLIALLVCNAYQLLRLPKYIEQSQAERQTKQQ